jgi:hypothetical protein
MELGYYLKSFGTSGFHPGPRRTQAFAKRGLAALWRSAETVRAKTHLIAPEGRSTSFERTVDDAPTSEHFDN